MHEQLNATLENDLEPAQSKYLTPIKQKNSTYLSTPKTTFKQLAANLSPEKSPAKSPKPPLEESSSSSGSDSLSTKEVKNLSELQDLKIKYISSVKNCDLVGEINDELQYPIDSDSQASLNRFKSLPPLQTVWPEEINKPLKSFLKEKANSANKIEKALYFDLGFNELWNRLLENGKIKPSLKSFSEISQSKWIECLSLEEQLFASYVSIRKIVEYEGKQKEQAKKNGFKAGELKFDFKSVRFHELANSRDLQCFFKDPEAFYLQIKPGLEKTLMAGYNLSVKWFGFLFEKPAELIGKKRVDNSMSFTVNNETFYFDKFFYKQMIRMMLTPFVEDANELAGRIDSFAHLSLIPLGINDQLDKGDSKYRIQKEMSVIQIKCYLEILQELELKNISRLDFSKFKLINHNELGIISHDFKEKIKQKLELISNSTENKPPLIVGSNKIVKGKKNLLVTQTWEEHDQNMLEPLNLKIQEKEKRPESFDPLTQNQHLPVSNNSNLSLEHKEA